MFVKVFADNRIALEDRHNFRAFKVETEGSPTKLEDVQCALFDLVPSENSIRQGINQKVSECIRAGRGSKFAE